MVDLDRAGGLRATGERERRTGVRVVQHPGLGVARAGPDHELGEIAAQDVVARGFSGGNEAVL